MKNSTFVLLAALAAIALALVCLVGTMFLARIDAIQNTLPTLQAGDTVRIQDNSFGCRVWYEAALAWTDCYEAGGRTGVVEDHPDELGHKYNGRVRVQTAAFGPLWFEPGDLRVP